MNRTQFRQLIIAMFLLAVLDVTVDQFMPSLIPAPVHAADDAYQQAITNNQSMLSLLSSSVVLLAYLIASFVGIIGLYFFRRWSLWLNATLIVIVPLLCFSLGYSISSWVSAFLSQWLEASIGFALAIAYFTPLKNEFK